MSRSPQEWRALCARHGQEHLASHLASLPAGLARSFESELEQLDFEQLDGLVALLRDETTPASQGTLQAPTIDTLAPGTRDFDACVAEGRAALRAGKVACVLVAGGQGSRLDHPGPKGTFLATPVRRKSLFQVFAEKVRAVARAAQHPLPLCIMTSEENDSDTRRHFEDRGYFGLPRDHVHFFRQGMLPAVDLSGKVVLKAPGALFRSPNGHGGALLALRTSGLVDRLLAAGIEDLFYFQVDNPLVRLCDPAFVGLHRLRKAEFSSKVVAKASPDEKVGVLARSAGRTTLIEYSDLSSDSRNARNPDGTLVFGAGNIAIHVLSLRFVARLTEGRFRLPFHMARKSLTVGGEDGRERKIEGVKFETFVFDALPLAAGTPIVLVRREDEFAPIKNAAGADSPATSMALQTEHAARLLEDALVRVPRGDDGAPRHPIEVSPLLEEDRASLLTRIARGLRFDGPLYLGDDE